VYFDLRVRKEGLDLQLIAEGTGVERDPDAPLPAPFAAGGRVERGPGGERYWSPTPAPTPTPTQETPAWPPPEAPPWRGAAEEPTPGGWLPPRAADPPGAPAAESRESLPGESGGGSGGGDSGGSGSGGDTGGGSGGGDSGGSSGG
jgi:hypothetical protein